MTALELDNTSLRQANNIDHVCAKRLLYGKSVNVPIQTQICLRYTVAGSRLVRRIGTRDPSGRIEDRAYFSIDAEMSPKKIVQSFCLRWTREEMHRNVKQHMGLEGPQNGWWGTLPMALHERISTEHAVDPPGIVKRASHPSAI